MAPVPTLFVVDGRLRSLFAVENMSVMTAVFVWMILCLVVIAFGSMILCFIRNNYREISINELTQIALANEPKRFEYVMDENGQIGVNRPPVMSPPITDPAEFATVYAAINDIVGPNKQ